MIGDTESKRRAYDALLLKMAALCYTRKTVYICVS